MDVEELCLVYSLNNFIIYYYLFYNIKYNLIKGGYKGCGHGHIGHPGIHHWSCCGSIFRYGYCLSFQKYQLLF